MREMETNGCPERKKEKREGGRILCMSGGSKDVVTDMNFGSKEKSTVETHNSSSLSHFLFSY